MADNVNSTKPDISGLVGLSNRYGGDPRYVLVGGGNSSLKIGNEMYIKSSGYSLATITADGFCGMDRNRLNGLMNRQYNRDDDAGREAAVLADMMDARLPGYGSLRPSVETLLHNLFPYSYVLHLHPALVNGMTCGADGESAARELFGENTVWVPEYKPGYELSKLCEKLIKEYTAAFGAAPKIVFLQNHGVFVASDDIDGIDALYAEIMGKLDSYATVKPAAYPAAAADPAPVTGIIEKLQNMPSAPEIIYYVMNPDVAELLGSPDKFKALSGAFTPDHIVYCKAYFMYLNETGTETADALPGQYAAFVDERGYEPRVICVRGGGALICANTKTEADNARVLFEDAVKVAVYSKNFGGPRHMSAALTDFISNWEIEQYRQKIAQM